MRFLSHCFKRWIHIVTNFSPAFYYNQGKKEKSDSLEMEYTGKT